MGYASDENGEHDDARPYSRQKGTNRNKTEVRWDEYDVDSCPGGDLEDDEWRVDEDADEEDLNALHAIEEAEEKTGETETPTLKLCSQELQKFKKQAACSSVSQRRSGGQVS
ncbi:unnamed protein product, partial [Amoebophrya sp. A120]|eukprot:GSA120T00012838001.1